MRKAGRRGAVVLTSRTEPGIRMKFQTVETWSVDEAPDWQPGARRGGKEQEMFSQWKTLCGSSCSHPPVSVLPSFVPHLKDTCSENRATSFLFCLSVYELSTNDNNYHCVCYFSSACDKTPDRHYLRGGRVCLGWGSEGSVSHCQEVKMGEEAERGERLAFCWLSPFPFN